MTYTYTNIADLAESDKRLNVYGLVKYFRPPTSTKTGQYNAFYTLIDPSVENDIESGVRCNFFSHTKDQLPQVERVGDIVRLHRVIVTHFNGRLQIKGNKGYSWLVFDANETGDEVQPKSSHPNPTLTDEDKDRVHELREFYLRVENRLTDKLRVDTITKLYDVHPETFFNCKVQVLAVNTFDEKKHCVLTVSDGSQVYYSSFRQQGEIPAKNNMLLKATVDHSFEISVFDDHVVNAQNLQPGDFIEIVNVHAKIVVPHAAELLKGPLKLYEVSNSRGWLELIVHTGTKYNRGIRQIPGTDDCIEPIKTEISKLTAKYLKTLTTCEMPSVQCQPSPHSSYTSIDFPLTPVTQIKCIYGAKVPNKYRVKVQVIAISPLALRSAVIAACPTCKNITEVDVIASGNFSSMQCLNCKDDILKVMYRFRLLLMDETGLIEVCAHGDEAEQFLNKTKPWLLLTDNNIFINYEEKLQKIVGNKQVSTIDSIIQADLPKVDICLYSYTSPIGVKFNLFGTSLI